MNSNNFNRKRKITLGKSISFRKRKSFLSLFLSSFLLFLLSHTSPFSIHSHAEKTASEVSHSSDSGNQSPHQEKIAGKKEGESVETRQKESLSLDDLLMKIKRENRVWSAENLRREREFLSQKSQQKKLLERARADLKKQIDRSQVLGKAFENNEKILKKQEEELLLSKGTLGEVFGVFKQVIGDLQSQIDLSVISSQIKGRNNLLKKIAKSKKIPTIKDLEHLWYELQREITESGKVVQYEAHVVTLKGEKKKEKITRVGSFNLVSKKRYLTYQPSTKQIMELARQPKGKWIRLIDNLEEAKKGELTPFGVDPSRGALLSVLIQTPSLSERIHQGGIVGYFIIFLLIIGLALVIERIIVLKRERKKIDLQMETKDKPHSDNFLGRLMKVFNENKNINFESLELKMEEEILKNRPFIERGIGTIKILATISPLLGLLGTVTGMIVTFQSITLFGTGDPKLMAGGISQALVTTVLGLICAIPLTLLHSFISEQSQKLLQTLEEESLSMMAQREK